MLQLKVHITLKTQLLAYINKYGRNLKSRVPSTLYFLAFKVRLKR